MKIKIAIFVCLFIIVICFTFISVGYSAFNSELSISGEAIVRPDLDLRITNIEYEKLENGAEETYTSEYSGNITTMHVKFPNVNSYAIYNVVITNKTGKYFSPNLIEKSYEFNNNLKYELIGIESYGVYQGSSYTFKIKITTTAANQEGNVSLKYDLKQVEDTVWTFKYKGSEEKFIAPYKATYKLEAWGAQGGTGYRDGDGIGGYGAYARGNTTLDHNQSIFINVGQEGALCTSTSLSYPGGYNGGGDSYRWDALNTYNAPGGGATHIATKSGLLSSLSDDKGTLSSTTGTYDSNVILIVAAGGGGASSDSRNHVPGGAGGGIVGNNGTSQPNNDGAYGLGGTQTAGGSFYFYGGTRTKPTNGSFGLGGHYASNGGSGGGGGFFGGGGASVWGGSGGGSSYIGSSLLTNKAMYCYKCITSNVVETKTISVENSSSSPIAEVPKEDDGYAKITLLPSNQ